MKHVFGALVALLLASSTTACFTTTAVVSVEKKAYVVKGTIFGSSMYHCTAESGKPVCTSVTED